MPSPTLRLPDLPAVPDRRLALRLTPDALRQMRGGHPWIYAESITSGPQPEHADAIAGTLAVVFDEKRRFSGIGLWDPTSPIRCRMLHAGRPTPIDRSHWRRKIDTAAGIRHGLESEGTTGFRLLNGENDGTGGLVVDRYASTLVVKLYSAAWLPHLADFLSALIDAQAPDRIVLRLGRLLQRVVARSGTGLIDGQTVYGSPPEEPVRFLENGLTFEADVLSGQKTGHFLDQRHNRSLVRSLSRGADVLDVFCCTGGFSVHAAAGGATTVHSIDRSRPAVDSARRIMSLNADHTATTRHTTAVADAFEALGELAGGDRSFDVIVVDPPAFASRASEKQAALRAYGALTRAATGLLRPGGRLVQASCSARVSEEELVAVVRDAIVAEGRSVRTMDRTGHAVDHPVTFSQGKYLKAVFAIVD